MKNFFNQQYMPMVGNEIRQTFNSNIDELISKASSGPDSCWLQIKSGCKVVGMCVYNLDLT